MRSAIERATGMVGLARHMSYRGDRFSTAIALAWHNLLADKRRLIRSTGGIAFAALLMLLQVGFRGAYLESALEVINRIDGDIFITSATKFRFGRKDPFSRRQLYAARGVDGVEWARPIYGEWMASAWKNPQTRKIYNVQVLAFDPDQPVFLFPDVDAHLQDLKLLDTALYDQRARRLLGSATAGTLTELARREIRVVGTFALGPDFTTDGTVITSDRTFQKFFATHALAPGELADVEFGVVKISPDSKVEDVKRALLQALPASIAVRTKAEQIALEIAFQNSVSPVGPIFMLGAAIGFIVGMIIAYQILYTDLSDQLPQYATLKAIGYRNSYLVQVVLAQAAFYALAAFLAAWAAGIVLFHLIGEIALLPLRMTAGIALAILALTLGMCLLSGLLAVRRVLAADPADVF